MSERIPVQVLGDKLHAAGIPIYGVSDNGDGTFRVDYAPEATEAQKTQGEAIAASFEAETDTAWVNIRLERDAKLYASDWTQVADVPLTTAQKQLWQNYRQQVRDVPQNFSRPDEVIWPDPPTEIQLAHAALIELRPAFLADIILDEEEPTV